MTSFNAGLRKFKKNFRESFLALSFNVFGIVAGTVVALLLGLFEFAPWTVVMYPAILSARGVIAGLLSGRLSTALHVGTMEPRFLGNTKSFKLLMHAILVLTVETSVLISVVAVLFGGFLWNATVSDFISVLGVVLATMIISLVVITPLTVMVSAFSFRHGLDPDIVLYPVQSTVSDILVTFCYFFVLSLFVWYNLAGLYIVVLLSLSGLLLVTYILLKDFREAEFIRTVKESVFTLVIVAFIVNVTGSVLSKINTVVGSRREIYTTYPAIIDTVGDVGAVVGSTATTKLALGTLKSSFSSLRNHAAEIFSAWAASLLLFVAFSALALATSKTLSLSAFLKFTTLLIVTNFMAAFSIILIAYTTAILTFQRGLDPDNFVIPIESSLADSITTISLFVALSLIG